MAREWDFRVSKTQLATLRMTADEYAVSRFSGEGLEVKILDSDDLYVYIGVTRTEEDTSGAADPPVDLEQT